MADAFTRPVLFRLFLASFFLISCLSDASAQDGAQSLFAIKEVTPVEVGLMYKKLLKQEPDYAALAALNPAFKDDPTRFGNAVLVQTQLNALKNIYDGLTPDTVFMLKKRVALKDIDTANRRVVIANLSPAEPFPFPLDEEEPYGIFLHNVDDVTSLAPPYEYDDFYQVNAAEHLTHPAEIIVKPIAADTKPFVLTDGKTVKPLIADIVAITIFDPAGKRIALQKRFKDWTTGKTPSLLELKDNPIRDAAPPPTPSLPTSPSVSSPSSR